MRKYGSIAELNMLEPAQAESEEWTMTMNGKQAIVSFIESKIVKYKN